MKASALHALVLVVVLATPGTALAWTDAHIDGVRAKVEVDPNGKAEVTLNLSIDVRRGWLTALELRGLAPDLELSQRYMVLRSEDGERYHPEVEVGPEGGIILAFERKDAPRRGQYRTTIRYRTDLARSPSTELGDRWARVSWSLPAWEAGLTDIVVEIRAPKGSRPVPIDQGAGVRVTQTERGDKTIIRWKRVQLPRMTPWLVTFDLPASNWVTPTIRKSATVTAEPMAIEPIDPPEPTEPVRGWLLSALLALCCLLKRQTGRLRPWLPASPGVAFAGLAALVTITEAPWVWLSWLGMVAISLKRPQGATLTAPLGQWRSVGAKRLGRRKIREGDWLDATTPTGLLALFSIGLVVVLSFDQETAATALVFFVPVFLCGTRFHRGITPQARLHRLLEFLRGQRLPAWANGLAYGPVAFATPAGEWLDARVRIHCKKWSPGVHSVDLVVGDRPAGLALRSTIEILVVARAASPAHDLLRGSARHASTAYRSNALTAFSLPWSEASLRVICELVADPDAKAARDSGTWIFRYSQNAA